MAPWLVRLSPDQAVLVRALAGDIVLCSWARHLTLTVPLSTQVYKWVPCNGLASNPGGSRIDQFSILGSGLELACNGGSCGGISLNRD